MKVTPKSSELQDVVQSDSAIADKIAAKLSKEQAAQLAALQKKDSVALSTLASALNDQLNPTQLANERQTKINDIKTQIQNGTYKPSSTDVAQSIAQEISLEILSQGGLVDEAN